MCSPASYGRRGQVVGATCGPGDWAKPASTVGVCCFYPADLPNQTAGATCACSPAFVCEPGSMRVASCSAASFPAPAPMTCPGGVQVASCTPRGDAGTAPSTEAGVCGSGPRSACNQIPNLGTVVTAPCVAGSAPAQSGGTIADGNYVLVSATAYTSSCAGVTIPGAARWASCRRRR